MSRLSAISVPLLLAASLCISCRKEAESRVETPPPIIEAKSLVLPGNDARQFGMRFEKAFRERDEKTIVDCFRMRDMFKRILKDLGVEGAEAELEPFYKKSDLDRIFSREFGKISCKFLRVRQVEGQHRALIRFVGEESGLTYREFTVARYPDGSIASDDIFQFETAELLSQTLRRLLEAVAPDKSKNGKPGADRDDSVQIALLIAMTAAVKRRDGAAVIEKYNQLSEAIQKNKSVLFLYVKGLSWADGQKTAFLKALEQFRTLFPDDPCLDLLLMAYHREKGEYAEALEPIERLDQSIGGDPYLRVVRAECHIGLKEFYRARAETSAAIDAEPDLSYAYWTAIQPSLIEKKHHETLGWLKKVVDKCGVEIPDLADVEEYQYFVKSPQHQEWTDWYGKRKK
jgi:hypothetical protein